ncbi:MAG: hypothetical protein ACRDVZ_05185 [Jiangellaceae bacterium]
MAGRQTTGLRSAQSVVIETRCATEAAVSTWLEVVEAQELLSLQGEYA